MRRPEKFGPASLLAPAIVPLLALAVISNSGEGVDGINAVAVFWITVVSYAGFFAFGYPLAKVLYERGTLSIGTLLVSGLISGAVVGLILGLLFGALLGAYKAPTLALLLSFGGLGGLVAFLFGLLSSVLSSKDP